MTLSFVVDVGCYAHPEFDGDQDSIPLLVDRFHPSIVFGFDPWPDLDEDCYRVGDTLIVPHRLAAWTKTTKLDYDVRNVGSTVMREKNLWGEWKAPKPARVQALDFPGWLDRMIQPGEHWVVKLDCEGAEFPILEAMVELGVDNRVDLLLVEWHDDVMQPGYRERRHELERRMRCPVELWTE